jgi:hypothetical protein
VAVAKPSNSYYFNAAAGQQLAERVPMEPLSPNEANDEIKCNIIMSNTNNITNY